MLPKLRETVAKPPPIGRIRRADVQDMDDILKLMNEAMRKTFRCETKSDVIILIKYAVIAICQLDVGDNVIGFLAVKDYPHIPSIHPKAWEYFIWTKYKAIDLRARNTLFLHMLCWKPIYSREVVDNMLRSLFMHDAYLEYVVILKPIPKYPLLVPGQSRGEASFRRVQTMERGIPGDRLPMLCIAERKEVCPRLRIRRAVEEDNDDIIPIINKHSERLKEIYGDYYISELISRHPESERVILVCEHNELAVGVMCLNTQIDFSSIEENYDISVFSGLRKSHTCHNKQLQKSGDGSMIDISLLESLSCMYHIEHNKIDKGAKVSWVKLGSDTHITDNMEQVYMTEEDEILPQQEQKHRIDFLELLGDDEEELEFDIINIDTNLIRVPQLLSYDDLARGVSTSLAQLIEGNIGSEVYDVDKPMKDKKKYVIPMNTTSVDTERYSGPSNAFLLELFAIHEDYDERIPQFPKFIFQMAGFTPELCELENIGGYLSGSPPSFIHRYGFDMLETAFELFSEFEYCIMSIPTDRSAFPLLEHFVCLTPISSKSKYINENLYITHVNSVRGKLKVRPGEAADISHVNDVSEHSSKRTAVMELFVSSLTSYSLESFLLLSENQPVGVIIVGPLKDSPSVRTHYDIEPDGVGAQADGAVLVGILQPIFEPHGRWYFREVFRQSEYNTLFWINRLVAKAEVNPKRNLMSLAAHMVPIRWRKPMPNIVGTVHLNEPHKATPFSVWYIERQLTSWPKIDVNQNIVVVGASSTGLAFIETLIAGASAAYLTMTNITLVSEHGLPTLTECLKAVDLCIPRRGRHTDRYIKTVPFYYYIDVINTCMVKIDRENRCIHFKGGVSKFYDQLILTCGLQFQHPEYLEQFLILEKEQLKGKPCERILMDNPKYLPDQVPSYSELPENVMIINTLNDANVCLRRLMRLISAAQEIHRPSSNLRVIVYGECLDAYACMSSLLEIGLTGEKITFVEPFPPEDLTQMRVNCFNNETIDQRVQEELENKGILIYRNCHFYGWVKNNTENTISQVRLMSDFNIINMPCFAFFYYGLKAIDIYSFKAINECGLVYDGGVVIGDDFETNDPRIFAAGPCTKYSRRHYADKNIHKYYNSEEIGETLAHLYLRKIDPFLIARDKSTMPDILPHYTSASLLMHNMSFDTFSEDIEQEQPEIKSPPPKRRWRPVLRYKSPITVWVTLPGPLYYFKLRAPGAELPMEVALTLPRQGHTLITNYKDNYFRLQLNVLHCIESVTCLSKEPFMIEIMMQLYGKHESYYNNLLKRFEMKLIPDLYDYFSQPWMNAMYQEPFEDMLQDLREQELGTVFDLARSRFQFTEDKDESISQIVDYTKIPEEAFGPESAEDLGIFRDIVKKYVMDSGSGDSQESIEERKKVVDIPSECGQSCYLREEAKAFWDAVGGERITVAHIGRYLTTYRLINQNYAQLIP